MKTLTANIHSLVEQEYERAAQRFGEKHNSPHEAYAVIREEFDEVADEANILSDALDVFWHEVKNNDHDMQKEALNIIQMRAILGACELIQVAAMAYKAQMGYKAEEKDESVLV